MDSRGQSARLPEMAQTFLTAAEIVELVAAYEAGETLRRLDKQFHIHRLTATAHLARRGVPVRQRSLGSVQNKGGRPGLPSRLHARATITSSASATKVGGISRPMALAVLRLTTKG